jgi:Tol biopolymer transport system component
MATTTVPTTVPAVVAPATVKPTQDLVVTLNPTYEAPTSILFVSETIYHYDLFTFNVDNNELRNLTASNYNDYQPSISPKGDLIAFSSNRGGNYEIYLSNLIGMDQTLLVNDPGADTYPTWSPDGEQIAFVSDRSGKKEIYTINVQEALHDRENIEVRRITQNQLAEEHLSWSPDGQYIVFHATISGSPEIFRVAVEGDSSEAEQLTFNDATDKNPTYLPDGRISFESNRDGIYEIYIMNDNGSSETRITQNNYGNHAPNWTPDGQHLVFYAQCEGDDSYEIYFIDLKQPYIVTGQEELHRLTDNDEDDQDPIWLPVSESP